MLPPVQPTHATRRPNLTAAVSPPRTVYESPWTLNEMHLLLLRLLKLLLQLQLLLPQQAPPRHQVPKTTTAPAMALQQVEAPQRHRHKYGRVLEVVSWGVR